MSKTETYGRAAMVGETYFDSITEAMWFQYFLDQNMDPIPQPQSFKLYSGVIYTPDFYLPYQDTYVEVKWGNIEYDTADKAQYLACDTGSSVLLIDGRPLDPQTVLRLFSADGDTLLLYNTDMSSSTLDDAYSYPPTFKLHEVLPTSYFKTTQINVSTRIDQAAKNAHELRRQTMQSEVNVIPADKKWSLASKEIFDQFDRKSRLHPAWYKEFDEY